MKILKYAFILLLIVIIAISIFAAIQPSQFDVQRSRVIEVPQSVVYNNVIDYKNWHEWGAWQEQDPTLTYTYPEKTSGIGGSYSWDGKDGKGSMETISADAFKNIEQEIKFEGFEPSEVYWNFENVNNSTKVTWGMKGDQNFMLKLLTLVTGSMDEMVGPMYERGLEKLDSLLVKRANNYNIEVNGVTQHNGGFYLYKSTSTKLSGVAKGVEESMKQVQDFASANNITPSGAPFIIYHKWDEQNDAVVLSTCIPTSGKVITTVETDVLTGELAAFTALKTTLTGNYTFLKNAWEKAMQHINENKLLEDPNISPIEVYTKESADYPNPSEWETEIYIPLITASE